MSKVRINDLARELEVKSRQVLDVLTELGMGAGKTHSSSLEEDEADKVRVHFAHGSRAAGHGGAASSRTAAPSITPKIDLSHISKPGDVLKAILAKKKEEEQEARHPHVVAKPVAPATAVKKPAVQAAPLVAAKPPAPATPAAPAPAPRKIVPQPRSAPPIVQPPAIASRPPSGPVVAKAPAGAARPVVVVAPPPAAVVVKPPVAPPKEEAPKPAEKPAAKVAVTAQPAPAAPVAPAPPPEVPVEAPLAVAPVAPVAEPAAPPTAEVPAAAAQAPPTATAETVEAKPKPLAPPAPPARRMVMPQTGPRPVYKAPPTPQTTEAPTGTFASGAGIQRGKPIFDRRPPGAPGGFQQRTGSAGPGQYTGGPRPKHPTRTPMAGQGGPGGPGGRPGFGTRPGFGGPPRPGFGGARPGPGGGPPPAAEAGRPQRAPSRGRARGQQQYPKTKEGPMKGFVPPPRYSGVQYSNEPVPITRDITVTEGISVKDLAEKLEVRAKDLIASLLMTGVFVTVNQSLDAEMVKEVSAKFGANATVISYEEELANQAIE